MLYCVCALKAFAPWRRRGGILARQQSPAGLVDWEAAVADQRPRSYLSTSREYFHVPALVRSESSYDNILQACLSCLK